tara:strand:- start:1669 stop:2739 length:1071 start_codon:yes stop_codon:yes gene_type:complete
MALKKNKNFFDEDTIDIIYLLNFVWSKKKLISKFSILFLIVGIIISLNIKNKYQSSISFYPDYNTVNNNQISGLAGLVGINLNEQINSNNIPVNLYPNIIGSASFKKKLLATEINLDDEIISYKKYLLNEDISTLDQIIQIIQFPLNQLKLFLNNFSLKKIKKKEIEEFVLLELSSEEYYLHKLLNNIISLKIYEEGYVELTVIDNNPNISSTITDQAYNLLQEKIIDHKIKKLNDVYKFIENQLKLRKKELYRLQDSLAIFSDSNKNIKSDLFQNKLERIKSEYNLSISIYNELSLNKEKTAIEVKRNTPIFTIINPVVKPNERFYPNRRSIVILFTLVGFSLSILFIFYKEKIN